jgi:hypothetical protein
MRAKLFFILALLLSADIALADSFTATGSVNLTIGTSGVSGTAGLLYGDGATLRSLPGTVTIGSNYKSLAVGNNVQLSLTTDGTSANFAATLALINTNTSGGWGNALEVYSNLGGLYALETYINGVGIYYSRLNMVISGHVSPGAGSGGQYGGGYSILPSNANYQNMYDCWSDITGSCYTARTGTGAPGELSFSGQTHTGVFTIGLDAENSQFILGNTTITSSGQYFVGDTSISRLGAGQIAFGNASAGGADFSGSIKLSGINDQGFVITKSRVVSASTDTVSASTDYFVCVAYTSTGAVTETLPAGVAGQTFLIKDCGGAAATHAITITPASGTIDGGSSYSLSTNYGSVAVTYVNSQWSTN